MRAGRRLAAMVSLAVALICGLVAPRAFAWWTDTATVTTTATALTVPKVPATTCAVAGNAVTGFTATIGWTVQTAPVTMSYTAKVRGSAAAVTVTTSGSSASVQVTSSFLSSLGASTTYVDITTVLPGAPSWTSPTPHTRALTVGVLGTSLACGADT
ncbi:hypothetical protein P5P86_10560 [Nocardioides sp. BP30]|uniref:hypothetical protein n=1 Tax=Nocardioides sp. BP30 TaxID=3036374 RepID=UPI002468E768|nr:hypothetical protein [Nocardioides sp. BP30]WGL50410.1 hypothetical protein P5P86_10560 [Nocardioides sp. BP30]